MSCARVREKLESLPRSPGVYLFRGHDGQVLYVGKAAHLNSRVRSYFQPRSSDGRYFISLLDAELADIETVVVANEKEAALLENQLIKEHRPRYNVKLRDDKDYLSLRLNPKVAWTRLEAVRRPRPDGALYFGPYHSATAARQTLRLVNRHFQLRTCTDAEMSSRRRPCLQHQIQRCPAPCVLPVDQQDYEHQARLVALFLDGRHDELVKHLQSEMARAARELAYERAARYRDQLQAVEGVRQEQNVASVRQTDQDVIGLYRQADQAEMAVVRIRGGKVVGVRSFDLSNVRLPNDELLASFVSEYYGPGDFVPAEVLLPQPVEAMGGLAELLGERRGSRTRLRHPQRGPAAKLLSMAQANAQHAFKEKARERENVESRLEEVRRQLRLPSLPRRIECVDISHSGGEDTVAAIVAFRDGAPDRRRYRTYHVRSVRGGDDYGAMYEVLGRRFVRGKGGEAGWELPDVMVVDGGRGQLQVALTALKDLEIEGLPVVALAKEKAGPGRERVVDRVYLPGQKNPLLLRESSPSLQVLAFARDEAHRASNTLRTRTGRRRATRSALDGIPGVGAKTKASLLRGLGSLDAVRNADDAALRAAGASRRQVEAIRQALGPGPAAPDTPGDAEDQAIDDAFRSAEEATGRS